MAEEKKETPKTGTIKIVVTDRGGYRIGDILYAKNIPFDISIENYNAMKNVVKHEVIKQ